jgi:hypothetical protein
VPPAVLDLLAAVCQRTRVPGVLLERDGAHPSNGELAAELAAIRRVREALCNGGRIASLPITNSGEFRAAPWMSTSLSLRSDANTSSAATLLQRHPVSQDLDRFALYIGTTVLERLPKCEFERDVW